MGFFLRSRRKKLEGTSVQEDRAEIDEKSSSTEDLDYVLAAISHETRRSIIKELGKSGSLSFSELMQRSGVKETGTFGFHLRRVLELVQTLPDGRYQLSSLGERAYETIQRVENPEMYVHRSQLEEVKPVEVEPTQPTEVPAEEPKIKTLAHMGKLYLDKERLMKYDKLIVEHCEDVLIDNDIDLQTARKILAFKWVETIWTPKHLYKLILTKMEQGCEDIKPYEGELPILPEGEGEPTAEIENYMNMIVNASRLKMGTRIKNYGEMKFQSDITPELADKNIASIMNYGVINVPKGLKEILLSKMEQSYGPVIEY